MFHHNQSKKQETDKQEAVKISGGLLYKQLKKYADEKSVRAARDASFEDSGKLLIAQFLVEKLEGMNWSDNELPLIIMAAHEANKILEQISRGRSEKERDKYLSLGDIINLTTRINEELEVAMKKNITNENQPRALLNVQTSWGFQSKLDTIIRQMYDECKKSPVELNLIQPATKRA